MLPGNKHSESFLEILIEARKENILSESEYLEYQNEFKKMIKIQVLSFNHGRSSSLSKDNYSSIMHNLDYLLAYGIDWKHDLNYIKSLGLFHLQYQLIRLKNSYQKLLREIIYVPSYQFVQVIYEQYPRFFKKLSEDISNYGVYDEDFDYPLLDGLSMDHHNYGLISIQFAQYYLDRLIAENELLKNFGGDTSWFFTSFQQLNKLPKDLASNGSALCLVVSAIHYQLQHQFDLRINIQQLKKLREDDFRQYLTKVLEQFSFTMPYDYEVLLHLYQAFCQRKLLIPDANYLINNEEFISNDDSVSNDEYRKILADLFKLEQTERVEYLLKNKLNINDLIDLLDNGILDDEHVKEYFGSFTIDDLRALMRKDNVDEFSDFSDNDWEKALLDRYNKIKVE